MGFLRTTPPTFPSRLMDFTKASKALVASLNWGSEIMDQGLLFEALLRNLLTTTRMAFEHRNLVETAIFLTETQVKLL